MKFFELQILTLKEMLDWRVSLDILLISAGIFFLYNFLRRTGTLKIVISVLAAAFIYVLARFLNLKGIVWIYSYLSPIIMIAIVIVFQPEIRKLFERAVSLWKKGRLQEDTQLSSMITDAVYKLANQKRGAIIVLPGKDLIQPWVSEGVVLNASPSIPLLLSIFDTHSPGHDGAVVIENSKVISFSVRLPLSSTGTIPEELGTRHHAGLGLSEHTDALVIVVSEEKGTVSVFRDGHLESISKKEDLAVQIVKHWELTASYPAIIQEGKKRRTTIIEMAASFILAVLFWSTVVLTQSQMQEMEYTVPIEYSALPDNVTSIEEKDIGAKIVLLGLSSDLMQLDAGQLKIQIDLSKMSPGSHFIPLNADYIKLPENIKLITCDPPSIEFVLK